MKWYLFILIPIYIGCAKTWPAALIEMQGFQPHEKSYIIDSIEDLNYRAGQVIVDLEHDWGYEIYIQRVPKNENTERFLGLARRGGTECIVELREDIFTKYTSYISVIVWHELGHCRGYRHHHDPDSIMYPYCKPLNYYSQDSINWFLNLMVNGV